MSFLLCVGFISLLQLLAREARPGKPVGPSETWTRVAARFDAGVVRTSSGHHFLRGNVRGRSVKVTERIVRTAGGETGSRTTLEAYGPFAFRACKAQLAGVVRFVPVNTGDPHLDDEVHIEGDDRVCLALLDETTRFLLKRLFRFESRHTRIDRSLLVVELDGVDLPECLIVDLIAAMVSVAERARCLPSADTFARLRRNAQTDPFFAVRRRCLETMLGWSEATAETQVALREAEASSDPGWRLLAAMASGSRALDRVARFATDERIEEKIRHRAQSWLAAFAARGASQVDLRPGEAEWIASCVAWLGRVADVSEEPFLLPLLSHDTRPVQLATANALARLGGRASVEPLLAISRRLLEPRELRSAALLAARTIQGRLRGDPGCVSLVESGIDGALSPPIEGTGNLGLVLVPR